MKVGLLCGREYSFPPAFIDRVNTLGRDHGITAEMVTLTGTKMGEPPAYRVIVDLPEVSFQMPEGLGTEKRGLVTGYRYGMFAPGKSRIVIDVSGPFLVDKAFVLEARADQPARLVVDLVVTDRTTFLAKLRAARIPVVGSIPKPKPQAQATAAKPVVILDPGHGGIDPGTASADGVTEKEVVLAFAKTLRQKLEAKGDYQVYLTREGDTFLALRERVAG